MSAPKLHCLGLNPGSAVEQLHGLGQFTEPRCASVSSSMKGRGVPPSRRNIEGD